MILSELASLVIRLRCLSALLRAETKRKGSLTLVVNIEQSSIERYAIRQILRGTTSLPRTDTEHDRIPKSNLLLLSYLFGVVHSSVIFFLFPELLTDFIIRQTGYYIPETLPSFCWSFTEQT